MGIYFIFGVFGPLHRKRCKFEKNCQLHFWKLMEKMCWNAIGGKSRYIPNQTALLTLETGRMGPRYWRIHKRHRDFGLKDKWVQKFNFRQSSVFGNRLAVRTENSDQLGPLVYWNGTPTLLTQMIFTLFKFFSYSFLPPTTALVNGFQFLMGACKCRFYIVFCCSFVPFPFQHFIGFSMKSSIYTYVYCELQECPLRIILYAKVSDIWW